MDGDDFSRATRLGRAAADALMAATALIERNVIMGRSGLAETYAKAVTRDLFAATR